MKNTWITHIWRTLAATALATLLLATPAPADAPLLGDMNGDGEVNSYDIDGFILCIGTGGCGHAGPVAWWAFDCNARDYGSDLNHGTEYGGYSYVTGVRESALSFDGTTGYADLQEITNLDGFAALTIAVWIKPATGLNADTGRQDFLYKGQPYQHAASYALNYDDRDGALGFGLHSASNWFDESFIAYDAEFPANEWFHVVCTYDGTSLVQMYVNGTPVGTEYGTGMNGPIFDIADPLTVGRRTDGNYYFNGALDELRIYDRELSPDAIQQLYETTMP
ncbi:MAG: LamG domain-containing protein [Planctomycetota bacterium]